MAVPRPHVHLKRFLAQTSAIVGVSACGLVQPVTLRVKYQTSPETVLERPVPEVIAGSSILKQKYRVITAKLGEAPAGHLDRTLDTVAGIFPRLEERSHALNLLLDVVQKLVQERETVASDAVGRLDELAARLGSAFAPVVEAASSLSAQDIDVFLANALFCTQELASGATMLTDAIIQAPVDSLPAVFSSLATKARQNADQGLILLRLMEEASETFSTQAFSAFATKSDTTSWSRGLYVASQVPATDALQTGLLSLLASADASLAGKVLVVSDSYASRPESSELSLALAAFVETSLTLSSAGRHISIETLSQWLENASTPLLVASTTASVEKLAANPADDPLTKEGNFIESVHFADRVTTLVTTETLAESPATTLLATWKASAFFVPTFPQAGSTISITAPEITGPAAVEVLPGNAMNASSEGAGLYFLGSSGCAAGTGTFSVDAVSGAIAFLPGNALAPPAICDLVVTHSTGDFDSGWRASQAVRVTIPAAEQTIPTLTIAAPSPGTLRSGQSAVFALTYSNANTVNLTTAKLSLNTTGTAACSALAVSSGTTQTPSVTVSGCTGNGTVRVLVAGGAAGGSQGAADLGAGPSAVLTVDNTGPTASIGVPSATVVRSLQSVDFAVSYAGSLAVNLLAGNVSVLTTGTASCAGKTVTNGTTDHPMVTLSGCTGDGNVSIVIGAGAAQDEVGNPDSGAGPSSTVAVDNTGPEVSIGAPSSAAVRSAQSVTFPVAYTGAATVHLNAADVTLVTTGTAACGTKTVSNGTTASPTILVANCTGDGDVALTIAAGTAADSLGNLAGAASQSQVAGVDNTGPGLAMGTPTPSAINASQTATFPLTYSNAATVNLTAGQVTLVTTGTVSCNGKSVTNGTTATPSVSVSQCSGEGTVAVSIAAGAASDAVGNTDAGAGPGANVDVDNTGPTLVIGEPSAAGIRSTGSVNFDLSYAGAASVNLTAPQITINTSGTAACSGKSVSNGTTATPRVTLSGCTGDGSVAITVAGGAALDNESNGDIGAGPSTAVTVDNTGPAVAIGAPSVAALRTGQNVSFGVAYSGANSIALTEAGVTVSHTGDASCSGKTVSNGTTASPTVTISGCTGNGSVSIAIVAGAASDALGNLDPGAGPGTAVTVDNTAPTVAIGAPSATAIRSAQSVSFGLTYSGASSVSLSDADISLTASSGVSCLSKSVSNGNTSTPTVTLSGCSGNGTVAIGVAAGKSQDAVGNLDAGSGPGTAVDVDNAAPTITIGAPSVLAIRSTNSVTFALTYAGATTINLADSDVPLTLTGTAACSTRTVTNGTTATPTVTVSGCTGDGSVAISVAAGGGHDSVGNADIGAGPGTAVVVDNTGPDVTIGSPSPASANASDTVEYGVSYTDAASVNLQNAQITPVHTGSLSCSGISVQNGTTATPTVRVSSCTGTGTITISLASGTALDSIGNPAPAAGPSVAATIDATAPSAPNVTSASSATFDTTPTWTWSGGGGGNGTFCISFNDAAFTSGCTETPATDYTHGSTLGDGSYTLYVKERDAASNWSAAGSFTVAIEAPPVTDGSLQSEETSTQTIVMIWNAANDALTPQENLVYTVYSSAFDNIRNLSEISSNGTVACGPTANLRRCALTGLSAGTPYSINVKVTDGSGNPTLYGSVTVSTAAFAGGTGVSGTPYQISSLGALNSMRHYPSAEFVLTTDIDASSTATWNSGSGWLPFVFAGVFSGNGYVIRGLRINRPGSDRVGLFSVHQGGSISGLTLRDAVVRGNDYVGILAGETTTLTSTISNTIVQGSVQGRRYVGGAMGALRNGRLVKRLAAVVSIQADSDVGGILGLCEDSTLELSYATGQIDATGSRVGGLVGHANRGTGTTIVKRSEAEVITRGLSYVGGAIGALNGTSTSATHLAAKGAVFLNAPGSQRLGGAVGSITGTATADYVIAEGHVNGTGTAIGGAVGEVAAGAAFRYGGVFGKVVADGGAVAGLAAGTVSQLIAFDHYGGVKPCQTGGAVTSCQLVTTGSHTPFLPVAFDPVVDWIRMERARSVEVRKIGFSNQHDYRISGSCNSEGAAILVSGAVSGSTTCTGYRWSIGLDFSALADGAHAVTVTQAGSESESQSLTIAKDTAFCATNPSNGDFAGGDGSSANPYLICTTAQFERVRNHVYAGTLKRFKLMDNLDLGQGFSGPIRMASNNCPKEDGHNFCHSLLGNGFVFSNWYYTDLTQDMTGLVAGTASWGFGGGMVFEKLGLEKSLVTTNSEHAGLLSGSFHTATLSHVHVQGVILGRNVTVPDTPRLGGIAGTLVNSTVGQVLADVEVIGGIDCAGGVAGRLEAANLTDVWATGNVIGPSGACAGSMAGVIDGGSFTSVTGSVANGHVLGDGGASFIAYVWHQFRIDDSYASGSTFSSAARSSSFIGRLFSNTAGTTHEVNRCYSSGHAVSGHVTVPESAAGFLHEVGGTAPIPVQDVFSLGTASAPNLSSEAQLLSFNNAAAGSGTFLNGFRYDLGLTEVLREEFQTQPMEISSILDADENDESWANVPFGTYCPITGDGTWSANLANGQGRWCAYRRLGNHSIRGGYVQTELFDLTGFANNNSVGFDFYHYDGTKRVYYEVQVSGDSPILKFILNYKNTSNVLTYGPVILHSVAYDPVNHRHLRLRHDIGTDQLELQTSPNGADWNTQIAVARDASFNPASVTTISLFFYRDGTTSMSAKAGYFRAARSSSADLPCIVSDANTTQPSTCGTRTSLVTDFFESTSPVFTNWDFINVWKESADLTRPPLRPWELEY